MKFVIFLYSLTLFRENFCQNDSAENFSSTDEPPASYETDQWMEMPLDHFNLFDNRTWKMRYIVDDSYFKSGMPLFIEIGGEWVISPYRILFGQMSALAMKHTGLLVATEHRYYGKSLPFSTDFSTKNLRYLQIEQALEDLVYLIEHLKASTPGLENSKVIVHGCSYAGMLASWVRSRFPNTVDIAYASSAPLGVEMDYPEYYQTINDVYANVSGSCIETIKRGFNDTERMLKTEDGRKIIKDALRGWSCDDIDKMSASDIIATMIRVLNVQFDPVQYEEIGCLVMSMDNDDLSDFERLANFVVLKSKGAGQCPSFKDTEDTDKTNPMYAWIYQICTEMGFFQTLSRKNSQHPFATDSTLEEKLEACVKHFGEGITEKLLRTGIERVNRRYGGRHPQVTKLLTVHGTADPWRALGISEDANPETPVITLRGSHCVDDTIRDDDPPELIKSREAIRDIISKWIDQI